MVDGTFGEDHKWVAGLADYIDSLSESPEVGPFAVHAETAMLSKDMLFEPTRTSENLPRGHEIERALEFFGNGAQYQS
jgi:hypothetical protein